jgi:hypothetical protein
MSSDLRLTPVYPSFLKKDIGNGLDNRVQKPENTSMSSILQNYYKYNQLRILRDQQVSILDKLKIVEEIEQDAEESKYSTNITKGGLWKDWANEIMMF